MVAMFQLFLLTVTFVRIRSENTTLTMIASNSTPNAIATNYTEDEEVLADKYGFLKHCQLGVDLEPDEYEIFPNGSVFVGVYNRTYNSTMYALDGDILTICLPNEAIDPGDYGEDDNDMPTPERESLDYMSKAGIGISMVCLLTHLVIFAMVRDLQNLPGCNLASLCVSLFFSYLAMIVGQSEQHSGNTPTCIASAIFTQFFFLASFLWMFMMAFDVFRSILNATGSLRVSSKGFKVKKYVWNSCATWGTSLVFTVAALVTDNVPGVSEDFRPRFGDTCWFNDRNSLLVFFAGPVFIIICLNFLLFGMTAYKIYANRMRSSPLDASTSNLRKNNVMYFRLAVIMGVTWITGALAPLVQRAWMWYLFAALNTLQGFFILVAFSCTAKVRNSLRTRVSGERRGSEQTPTQTFQSYSSDRPAMSVM